MAIGHATALWDIVSAADVAKTLGSARLRGVRDAVDLDAQTRKGLPIEVLAALRRIGFSVDEIARITQNSARTIHRLVASRNAKARLNLTTSDRAVRLATVVALSESLLGSRDRAVDWIRTPNRYLGGVEPLTMLETDLGLNLVLESAYSVAFGGLG